QGTSRSPFTLDSSAGGLLEVPSRSFFVSRGLLEVPFRSIRASRGLLEVPSHEIFTPGGLLEVPSRKDFISGDFSKSPRPREIGELVKVLLRPARHEVVELGAGHGAAQQPRASAQAA